MTCSVGVPADETSDPPHTMKVAIIGGGGRVGSCAAFALQCSGVVKDLIILDANQATAEGEALDLLHGAAYCADQNIYAGTYADCASADLVCITAGLRRKPDESRLDLIYVGNEDDMMTDLKVGDRVLFPKYTGTELKYEGKTYLLMNEDDVLARINA